jgi:hypothetical protein
MQARHAIRRRDSLWCDYNRHSSCRHRFSSVNEIIMAGCKQLSIVAARIYKPRIEPLSTRTGVQDLRFLAVLCIFRISDVQEMCSNDLLVVGAAEATGHITSQSL